MIWAAWRETILNYNECNSGKSTNDDVDCFLNSCFIKENIFTSNWINGMGSLHWKCGIYILRLFRNSNVI